MFFLLLAQKLVSSAHNTSLLLHAKKSTRAQSTPEIACRNMGFESGFFDEAAKTEALLPPWLSGIQCSGAEEDLAACSRANFGNVSSCGAIQRLFCLTDRAPTHTLSVAHHIFLCKQ